MEFVGSLTEITGGKTRFIYLFIYTLFNVDNLQLLQ